jgi:hypothetical protein
MPKPIAPKNKSATSAKPFDLQCIRVDAQGYDATGAYWGAGPDVFIATSADGTEEITVRATSSSNARTRIAAERARPPGTPQAERQKLGGTSPNKTRYGIAWRDAAGTACVRVRITHSRDYLSMGDDHIEVESIAPKKAPLPITETGYRSHFVKPLDLANDGGPVTFVTAWLDREAKGSAWRKAQSQRAQGDLFQWAAAQTEATQRKQPAKRKATKPRPKSGPRKDKTP